MSIVRIGMAENKDYADGYDAIFSKKKPATPAKVSEKKAPAKKPAAPVKKAPAKKK